MICDHCGNWNYLDSKFCRFCGNLLDHKDFSLYHFFITNKDFFIIFGVFGALSLYLTNFFGDSLGGSLVGSNKYSIGIGIFNLNLSNLAIASALFLVIVVCLLLIFEAIKIPKYQGLFNSYLLEKGSIQRLIFLIPFSILIIGIVGYIYFSFIDEINQIVAKFTSGI